MNNQFQKNEENVVKINNFERILSNSQGLWGSE